MPGSKKVCLGFASAFWNVLGSMRRSIHADNAATAFFLAAATFVWVTMTKNMQCSKQIRGKETSGTESKSSDQYLFPFFVAIILIENPSAIQSLEIRTRTLQRKPKPGKYKSQRYRTADGTSKGEPIKARSLPSR